MAMEHIESVVLSGLTANVTFTSIPQDGIDLLLMVSAKTNRTGGSTGNLQIEFNGDTLASNYSLMQFYAINNAVYSYAGNIPTPPMANNSIVANSFSIHKMYIPNYASSGSKAVSLDSAVENNSSNGAQSLISLRYTGGSAISSIQLKEFQNFSFMEHMTLDLYKITS